MKLYHNYIFLLTISLVACRSEQESQPGRRDLTDAVFANGYLESNQQYLVTSTIEGYLKESFVDENDTVSQGQVLFRLSNEIAQNQVENAAENLRFAQENLNPNAPTLQQVRIQISQTRNKLSVDSANYARYADLIKTRAVSQVDFEKAKLAYENSKEDIKVLEKNLAELEREYALQASNARADLNIQNQNNQYYSLSSELEGKVLRIFKKNGELVKKGETLAEIGAGRLIIRLFVAEEDINRIQLGHKAIIELNTEKGTFYEARIAKIYPAFNEEEQAFEVEAVFEKELPHFKSGTQLQANIIILQKKNALLIPTTYLLPGDSVLVKDQKKKKAVKVGIRSLEWAEILEGLTENDRLIIPKSR
ncbi:MAG: efflux RND transporter periplasmic adaptor subunit [Microscillaceae bacterium]|nr:efflux RND transporter periplasmic adaptor subunit [Microscillaceae bacterium]